MNTRIRELAKQTITRFDQDMDGSMVPEEFGQWVLADDLQKFVELIVREWVGLTDEEMESIWDITPPEYEDRFAFARAVEATLRRKNHG